MKFYSHFDKVANKKKLLKDHLYEVWEYGCKHTEKEEAKYLIELLALTHDFGKYTTFFQEYLIGKGTPEDLKNHGLISAFLAGYLALKKYDNSVLPLLCFQAVLCHHGNLKNLNYGLPQRIKEFDRDIIKKIKLLKMQFADVYKHRADILKDYTYLRYEKNICTFFEEFDPEEIYRELKKIEIKYFLKNMFHERGLYYQFQKLYSLLIASDKLSASSINLPSRIKFDYNYIWGKKDELYPYSSKDINIIRSNIFENVQESIKRYKQEKIFTITAPTGSGKTCTGFYATLKLRELLGEERRIIYVLPFTTLIDQNYQRIQQFLGLVTENGYQSNCLVKHHHLAELTYQTTEEEYSTSDSELLVENWQSEVVVTTYVQFFQSILTHSNRMQKKVHSLEKAIILLDEIQAVDASYYFLLDEILTGLCQFYDCRVILMTATKPVILTRAVELLKDNEKYFKVFNRTVLQIELEPVSLSSFIEDFISKIKNKSYLIVSNTIQQSLDIYEKLAYLKRPVLYLSSNLIPYHRRKRVKGISKILENGEKPIVVSTQIIEAGVDLDFDEVIRDFAPFDSIIQCAGRCNRNNHLNIFGTVRVINMKTDRNRSFADYVYGSTNLQITEELLNQYNGLAVPEENYRKLLFEYFTKLEKEISKEVSLEFKRAMEYFDYNSENQYCLKNFSLIKNNPGYISVFFKVNKTAEEIFLQFKNLYSEKDVKKRYEKYLSIKAQLFDYIIAMPSKYRKYFIKERIGETDFYTMPLEGCEDYYSIVTGFVRKEKDNSLFL